MNVLLIVDRVHLMNECQQLHRLAVALTANGCSVKTLIPEAPAEDAHSQLRPIGIGTPLHYKEKIARWLVADQVNALCTGMERMNIDLIWTIGQAAWQMTGMISKKLERPIVLQIDGLEEARKIRKFRRSFETAGVIVPSEALRSLVGKKNPKNEVRLIPRGVAAGKRKHDIRPHDSEDTSISIAVLGCGRSKSEDKACLEALATLRRRNHDIRCVVELPDRAPANTWKTIRKNQLMDIVTTIGESARFTNLIAACDLLIRASVDDRVHPIVLEAMAENTPIITRQEPWLDHLHAGKGVTIVEAATSEGWVAALEPLLLSAERRKLEGDAARREIERHHLSSVRANDVLMFFEDIVGVPSLQMDQE